MSRVSASAAKRAAEQYREEGYTMIRGFLDPIEVAEARAHAAHAYAEGMKHPGSWRHRNVMFEVYPAERFGQRYVVQAHWPAWYDPWFETFRRRPDYLAVLEPILGPDIRQVAQQIHWKPPGANQTGYRMHQDVRFRNKAAYSDVELNTVNTGLAIDRSTVENGCLSVFPGSHKRGYLGLSDEGDGVLMRGLTQDEELRSKGIDPASIVHLEMEPGDLALWGLLTVHGSLPNLSQNDRAFLIQSYVKASASPNRGEWVFRDGEGVPLGPEPEICKFEQLREKPEPHYLPAW